MTSTGLIAAHIFFSIFLTPHEFQFETATVDHSETLVLGVSAETQEDWFAFLLSENVEFSIRDRGENVYVASDPIEILNKAASLEILSIEANRSLKERRIERQVKALCPDVSNPRVCIAISGTTNESEDVRDVVMVVAKNLPLEEKSSVEAMIRGELGGEPKIEILGCVESRVRIGERGRGEGRSVSLARR